MQGSASAAPLQPVSTKFPMTSKSRIAKAHGKSTTGPSGAKSKGSQALSGIPANVLVKRHQPNLQVINAAS